MTSRNLLQYMYKMNYVQIDPEGTILDEIAGAILAACGFYFQLSVGYTLPIPLHILLSPFIVVEYFLIFLVSK